MLLFQAKHLQFVSGVDVFSYWFATYTWDLLNYFVPALGILILFAAFQVDSYKDELGIVFLMLVSQHLVKLCFVSFLEVWYVEQKVLENDLTAISISSFFFDFITALLLLVRPWALNRKGKRCYIETARLLR